MIIIISLHINSEFAFYILLFHFLSVQFLISSFHERVFSPNPFGYNIKSQLGVFLCVLNGKEAKEVKCRKYQFIRVFVIMLFIKMFIDCKDMLKYIVVFYDFSF